MEATEMATSTPVTTLPTQSTNRIEPLSLFDTRAVDNLTNGFLAVLEPELVRVHKSLSELVYVSFHHI